MTALSEALADAGLAPAVFRRQPDRDDPQLRMTLWNHGCPARGCLTWVPNHRTTCLNHEETA